MDAFGYSRWAKRITAREPQVDASLSRWLGQSATDRLFEHRYITFREAQDYLHDLSALAANGNRKAARAATQLSLAMTCWEGDHTAKDKIGGVR